MPPVPQSTRGFLMSNSQAASALATLDASTLLADGAEFNGLSPHEIVSRALRYSRRPLLSTNFRPRAAALAPPSSCCSGSGSLSREKLHFATTGKFC